MKIISVVILVAVSFTILSGCPKTDVEDLVGSWTRGAITMYFLARGGYEVDIDSDGTLDVWGIYSVSKNRLTLIDDPASPSGCSGGGAGQYTFNISGNILAISLFSDPCSGRAGETPGVWLRR